MMLRTFYEMILKSMYVLVSMESQVGPCDIIKHVCTPETSMSCVNTVPPLKQLVCAGTALTLVGSLEWQ